MLKLTNTSIKYLLILCTFYGAGVEAISLDKLPFIGKKPAAQIQLPGNKALLELLQEELARQRKSNRQLQQYTKLNKIAHFETRLLTERLRSEGYYASQIQTKVKNTEILYQINPGPLYSIEQLTLEIPNTITLPRGPLDAVSAGQPLRAEAVLSAQKALTQSIAAQACLYEVDVQYRVKVFHERGSAQLLYRLKESPEVSVGEITFSGLESISPEYLRRITGITRGTCFQRSRLDRIRLNLMQSNLLARVDMTLSEPVNDRVDINFDVVERFHRTVSAGAGFQSDEGFGVSAGWEHRNWLGEAQTLSFKGHVAQQLQSLSSSQTFPNFHRENQSITFYADLEREDSDAFESKIATAGAEISRLFKPHLLGMVGAEIEFSEITEDNLSDTYALLSLPLSIEFDQRNDPLDPRDGWVAAARVRPYWDAYNHSTQFVKTSLAGSAYYTLADWKWQPTLAARAALGAINGIERDEVPANIRYYTGGGGSVRGYPYQTLGPLTGKVPDGGLSFSEVSFETRLHWGQDWGGVIFLDGGLAYEQSTPQFDQQLLWGAGVGIRYYTSFAPIRFDIAVPLDKRTDIDDSFQIYISIGQAF